MIAAAPWAGDWPIGAIAAGISAAAEALRYAIVNIALRAGHRVPAVITPGTSITAVCLGPQPTSPTNLGELTIISAGAVTQAAMYTLLRVPDVHGSASVYDDDVFEASNLNRYSLLVAEDLGRRKATQLGRWSNGLTVEGMKERYRGGDTTGSARMLIGADDIAIRWAAQRDRPQWLGIGATSHLFAEVSSHSADTPCAGCVHDHEDDPPAVIPTISVISGWAGLLLASELLHDVGGAPTAGRMAWSFPLGLSGRSGHRFMPIPPNGQCPVDCTASRGVLRSA